MPDALFFSRVIPIAAGASAADAKAQIELALEAVSPFPLAQLYYGWCWTPGSERAFLYAAYRRRFTAEQVAGWGDAELVMPISAALLGAPVEPATTAVIATPENLTAVYWETPGLPAKIASRPLDPAATDEDRAKVRDDLVRAMGGSKAVVDFSSEPSAVPADSDREIVFHAGEWVSRLPASVAAALDVRDKDELAGLRAARKRDVVLWRVALGMAAALALLAFGELALLGGREWQKVRVAQLKAQAPAVQKIMTSQELANRIDDLVTKRLLPFEMLTALVGPKNERLPADIMFTRVQTLPPSQSSAGLYTLIVEAQTNNPAQMTVYQSQLRSRPEEFEDVSVRLLQGQGDRSVYEIKVIFKPGALKPASSA